MRELLDLERSVGCGQVGRQVVSQACNVELFAVAHGTGVIDGAAHRGPREWDRMPGSSRAMFMPCCFKMRLATTALWTSSGPS